MLPLTIPLLFIAPLAGRLYDRIGPRPLLVAGSLLISARARLARVAPAPQHDYTWLIPGYVAMGIGIGMTIPPATTDALGAAAPGERSQASGITQTARQVGGVIGIAILGAIVAHVSTVAPGATAAMRVDAASDGVAAAYWTGAAMMAAMALVALAFVRRRIAR